VTHDRVRGRASGIVAVACVLAFALGVERALAQFPAPPSSHTRRVPATTANSDEGTVKKVDPAARKVEIATGLFGSFGRTLEVTPRTEILVEGRPSDLSGIREGARVRAWYDVREGESVARSINVVRRARPAGQTGPYLP
jgi:Cu/Ag efflux protein CusF